MELRKLVLSPKKVKSNCFNHCDGFKNDWKLYNFIDISWETVRKASVIRNDVTETINSMSYMRILIIIKIVTVRIHILKR